MRDIGYRPDIDGLRAIAVFLVIFYHVGFSFVPGGFVGVDVFFVISGYLITSIIKREIEHGDFSFSIFYARRIKRIIPALFVVLVSTSLFSLYTLFTNDLISYSSSLKYTAVSISNYFFMRESTDYFAQAVEQLPLLHTWSLSVEEQFYIIWPVILLLSTRVLAGNFNTAMVICLLLGFFSCLYSSYLVSKWPADAYYSLGSRAFELLIGCSIALFGVRWEKSCWYKSLLSIISLSGIVISSILLNKESFFPGYVALIPCLFAAAFIVTGTGDKGIANKIISNNVCVFFGKISYPLYLWHWPIIAIVNYKGIEKDTTTSVLIISATIILSTLTFFFVENPIKKKVKNNIFGCVVFILSPMIFFSFLFSYIALNHDSGEKDVKEYFSSENIPSVVHKSCFNSFDVSEKGLCKLGVEKGNRTGMLIGDSMAGHYIALVDVLAKDAGITVLASVSSGLPPVYAVKSYPSSAYHRTPEKLEYNSDRLKKAKEYDFVILSGSWGNRSPYFENESALNDVVNDFVNSGVKVYIISRPNSVDGVLLNRVKGLIGKEKIDPVSVPFKKEVNYRLESIKQSSMVTILDPNDAICEKGNCSISINDKLIYTNPDHITEFGARDIANKYLADHKNPFK